MRRNSISVSVTSFDSRIKFGYDPSQFISRRLVKLKPLLRDIYEFATIDFFKRSDFRAAEFFYKCFYRRELAL